MEVYRKISAGTPPTEAESAGAAEGDLLAELEDRFGAPPATVRTLLEVASLKRLAESLRVQSISAKRRELVIRLRRDARVDVERLIEIISERPGASFSPSGVLTLPAIGGQEMVAAATEILRELAVGTQAAPPLDPAAPVAAAGVGQ
jgi:transcription-repair coupling factor (superfamily II helicase)